MARATAACSTIRADGRGGLPAFSTNPVICYARNGTLLGNLGNLSEDPPVGACPCPAELIRAGCVAMCPVGIGAEGDERTSRRRRRAASEDGPLLQGEVLPRMSADSGPVEQRIAAASPAARVCGILHWRLRRRCLGSCLREGARAKSLCLPVLRKACGDAARLARIAAPPVERCGPLTFCFQGEEGRGRRRWHRVTGVIVDP